MLNTENVYFLGIGGIGMSALARYFKKADKNVAGYDRVQSELCQKLEAENIQIHYEDNPQFIPQKWNAQNTTVIYTPAIPDDHREMAWFKEQKFTLHKRAAVLGMIAQNHTCLAIAGTHGKTTTSALLAHIFREAGWEIAAFLGGIATNYQTNFWGSDENDLMVTEADEYDRSFLRLKPDGAAITSTDADHLDIYGKRETLQDTFTEFANSVTHHLFVKAGLNIGQGLHYSLEGEAPYRAENIHIREHAYFFDFVYPGGKIENIKSGLPGRYNIENTVAAASLAFTYHLDPEKIKTGIESFKGVKRRFEYHIKREELTYIDDYAHHPQEIASLAQTVRELYPHKRITAIFQPHLYSRTRDFAEGFAQSLSFFDELVLMDIYPARERPIPGINSQMLLDKVELENKKIMGRQEILTHFSHHHPEVILTIGAGDIDRIVQPLKMALLK